MMYAPYAVHAGDSGVLSNSARSTPHWAQYEMCILCSLTTARTVSAAAENSAYIEDLATRRLMEKDQIFSTHARILLNLSETEPPYPFALA
jgi:hypothetical protein